VKFPGRAEIFTSRNVALSLATHEVKIFPLENTKQKFSAYFSACRVLIDTKRLDEAREESLLKRVRREWRKGHKSALNWTWPLLCRFIQELEGGCRNLIVGKQKASSLYLPYSILLRFRLYFLRTPFRFSFPRKSHKCTHMCLSSTSSSLFLFAAS
jgi:hypothetical protein